MNEPTTMEPGDERKLAALLTLLDDPEPIVQQSVRAQLRELGPTAVAALRTLIERGGEEVVRVAARNLVREIGLDRFRMALADELHAAGPDGDIDLERSIFAVAYLGYPEIEIAPYQAQLDAIAAEVGARLRPEAGADLGYPEIDIAPYQAQLDAIAAEVGARLRPEAGAVEHVRQLSAHLVEELGFHGCRQENFYDPDNSFINRVLERRIGIPITLSAVYLLIAKRITMPLYGVSFPAHFLVKYQTEATEFLVDPFGGGQILDVAEGRRMLVALGIEERAEYFEPAPARVMLSRMLRNLAEIYRKVDPTVGAELDNAVVMLAA